VKDRVEITGRYVIAALLGYLALILSQPLGVYLVPPAVAYLTVAIGLWNCRISPVTSLSNYSYGVYLYGFPVQQVVSTLFPHHRFWWFNIARQSPVRVDSRLLVLARARGEIRQPQKSHSG